MLQVAIHDIEIDPGYVFEWNLVLRKDRDFATPGAAPNNITGYNQANHFAVAEYARSVQDPVASYVAGTFDIPGSVDLDALESSMLHFVERHDVLRAIYYPLDGDVACDIPEPGEVTLERISVGMLTSSDEVRRHVHETFKKVDTLTWPLISMGVVVRDDSATVFFSCDHLVTDGISAAIAVDDIASAYLEFSRGRQHELPATGSYLEFGRDERSNNLGMSVEDARLDHWREFVDRGGEFFPRFPLDLGVEPGRLYPPVNEMEQLLTADEVTAFESACRQVGGRLSMGLLTAFATSIRDEGGPDLYRGLVPVNERGSGKYANSVGWFINTLPIEFPLAASMSFHEILTNAQAAYARMRKADTVHFVEAWKLLAPVEYSTIRYWPYPVNFFSYIDYRRMPGAERHTEWRAKSHVWSSCCNGIMLWFQRNDTGLYLNSIYVDTPQARHTKSGLVSTLRKTMEGLIGGNWT